MRRKRNKIKNFDEPTQLKKHEHGNLFIFLWACFFTFDFLIANLATSNIGVWSDPITLDIGIMALIALTAYIVGIITTTIAPNKSVTFCKIFSIIATLSLIFCFIPFSGTMLSIFFYLAFASTTFITVFSFTIIISSFSMKTEIKDIILSVLFAAPIIALYATNLFVIPSFVFLIIATILIGLFTYGLYIIPFETNIYYGFDNPEIKPEDKINPVKNAPIFLFLGLFVLIGLSTFLLSYTTKHISILDNGKSIFYLAGGLSALLFIILLKKKLSIFNCIYITFALGFVGIVLSFFSQPIVAYISCIFLGFSLPCLSLTGFYGIFLFDEYQSRYISPSIILINFACSTFFSLKIGQDQKMDYSHTAIILLVFALAVVLFTLMLPILKTIWYRMIKKEKKNFSIPVAHQFSILKEIELKIVNMLLLGYSKHQICLHLIMTKATLEQYITAIYQNLGIEKRSELYKLNEQIYLNRVDNI